LCSGVPSERDEAGTLKPVLIMSWFLVRCNQHAQPYRVLPTKNILFNGVIMNTMHFPTTKVFGVAFLISLLFATLLGCGSTATRSSTGEYIDDSVITTKVKASILEDQALKVAEINVETYKGVVQLSGFVNSQSDINKAVILARQVKGVKSVKNDMRVK
jgi:hypothetical protein